MLFSRYIAFLVLNLVFFLIMFISTAFANQPCNIAALRLAEDLPEQVAVAGQECYQSWFSAPDEVLEDIYSEASLDKIQVALKHEISQYQGKIEQASRLERLGEFVRAAYYVRYNAKAPAFSEALSQRFAQVTNQFLENPYALQLGQEQVEAMNSLTLMVDNVKQLPLTMDSMMRTLEHFNTDMAKQPQWVEGVNNLFRAMAGHSTYDEFYTYMSTHNQHIRVLSDFARNNEWALGTEVDFLVYNAIRETGRLLASPYSSTRQAALDEMQNVMQRYPLGSEHERLWLAAVEMLNFYMPEGLNGLDLGLAKQQIQIRILPNYYECQGSARIRSQDLTLEQTLEACQRLADKENDFHQLTKTGFQPVEEDNNKHVEVDVFANKKDYGYYSSFLFNNTTNNGGQYLEGDPSQVDNVARFVAYRYENEQALAILNLEHEYVHYLDARFNQYGSFHDNLAYGHIVWWLEGFAEYMHYKQDYQAAISSIQTQKWSLSDVFATTYEDDANRIYRWGYLAVRFMFEKHPQEIESLLTYSRAGEFSSWAEHTQQLGEQLNEEFSQWLETLNTETSPSDSSPPIEAEEEQESGKETHPQQDDLTPVVLEPTQMTTLKVHQRRYAAIYVPEGVKEIRVWVMNESRVEPGKDLNLYASFDVWPTTEQYYWASQNTDSNEYLQIPALKEGYLHFLLNADSLGEDVDMVVYFHYGQ
ncbi:collagenase [Vibrio azureus]|uniref:microbial collagenase n=1 Tax=Vibrio azureus NBRC 104587 TaxID=1219077 RepID=U3CBL0_9VIBR|nr:putative collagenase [Vibrio azureus NBRC 104587]